MPCFIANERCLTWFIFMVLISHLVAGCRKNPNYKVVPKNVQLLYNHLFSGTTLQDWKQEWRNRICGVEVTKVVNLTPSPLGMLGG